MYAGLEQPVRTHVAGAALVIRPAAHDDMQRIQALVRGLSPRSRYLRFFNGMRELSPQWLERFTHAAPQSEVTLLALMPVAGSVIPVGMAQYAADPYPQRGDFAVVVDDAWQGLGIGARLIDRLSDVARHAGFERLEGEVLAENQPMLRLARALGFAVRRDPESALYLRVARTLAQATIH